MPLAILLLLILLPLTELELLWRVGSATGVWPVLAALLAGAIAGGLIIRGQGLRLATELRMQMLAGRLPGDTLLNAIMRMAAGALLIVPGFLTDLAGLLLLLPPVRRWGMRRLRKALQRRMSPAAGVRVFTERNIGAPEAAQRTDDLRETPVRIVEEEHGQERL